MKQLNDNSNFMQLKTGNTKILSNYFLLIIINMVMMLGGIFPAQAQQTWSLPKCIDYAVLNNIELNHNYNNIKLQKINLLESKAKLLPDLNLGSAVDLNYGRNIDGNTNTITYDRTIRNYYWLNSSVNIFKGFMQYNTIKFNKYQLLAINEEAILKKNMLIMEILTSYYMVLYSHGLNTVAQSQLNLSRTQFERMQEFVDLGQESPLTVQELKSQWAVDKLNLTRAQNNENKSVLQLKQLLRLDATQAFSIDTTDMVILVNGIVPEVDSIFKTGVTLLPQIKQSEYLLNASEKELAIAKGGISPRIYISAGFNTGYFAGDINSFNYQLTNNQNQWIDLGIVIPIFNGTSVYSQIKRKKIAVSDDKLKLEKQKEDLYIEIWNAIDELQSAENEYQSSIELHNYSKLTLQNVTKKMEKGLAGTTDFEAAKQRFLFAEASLLKSKLIFIMRKQMLTFYQTGNWSHLQLDAEN